MKENAANQRFINAEEKRLLLLNDRKADARCLKCGGYSFDIIPHPSPPNGRAGTLSPWRTGLKHAQCGGRIYMIKESANFFVKNSLPKRYYNSEGIEIATE